MTKKERIAALEAQVAELSARLSVLEARPYYHPYADWQKLPPYITCEQLSRTYTDMR